MSKALYFDYNATTPTDPRVVEAMLPYFTENFGNSMSLGHEFGWAADRAVEGARQSIAALLGCAKTELTFTSGATEANNWAVQGVMEAIRGADPAAPLHILSSPVEHSSVLMALEHARVAYGAEIEFLPLRPDGQIDPTEVARRLRPETRLVCVMWVQNEIGTIHPIREIGQICRERKVYLLSDATQAVGKVRVDLRDVHVDLMSFSAHKLYGPKGVGFLYHRKQEPHVQLWPLIHGGGHERGERSGTLNVPGIVGMAKALEIGLDVMDDEMNQLRGLRDRLWRGLQESYPSARLNGPPCEDTTARAPHNLNVSFPQNLVPEHIPQLAFSRGSACYSGKTSTSHVLSALGLSEEASRRTLRLSLGRMTRPEDIDQAIEIIRKFIK